LTETAPLRKDMESMQGSSEEVEHASLLEKAIECALNAHRGQIDKGGAPYILHPIRLMLGMEKYEERIVAVYMTSSKTANINSKDF
jgi:(p)ppGpp synthase/HD superfamily hydrolase